MNRPERDAVISSDTDCLMLSTFLLEPTGVETAKELHIFLKARGKVEEYPLFTFVVRPRPAPFLLIFARADIFAVLAKTVPRGV